MERGTERPALKWLEGQAEKEARRDIVPSSERKAQLIPVVGIVVVIAFFVIHQTRPTGFFTEDFGTLASVLLYGMLIAAAVPFLVRGLVGRKNLTRLFEAGAMVVVFVAHVYLLAVFPFNFTHFAAPLPSSLEFLLDWVSATLAKWVLGIGIIGSATFSVFSLLLYLTVKRLLRGHNSASQEAELR